MNVITTPPAYLFVDSNCVLMIQTQQFQIKCHRVIAVYFQSIFEAITMITWLLISGIQIISLIDPTSGTV